MTTANVLLNTIAKVKEFVRIVSGYGCDIDLYKGNYVVDAKSIMGIFSMDLSNTLGICIHEKGEEAEEILSQIQGYLV